MPSVVSLSTGERDSQGYLFEAHSLMANQSGLLNRFCEMEEVHELRDPRPGDI